MQLSYIPNDMLLEIFKHTQTYEDCVFALVSKKWNDIVVGSSYRSGYTRRSTKKWPSLPRESLMSLPTESSMSSPSVGHAFIYFMWDGHANLAQFALISDNRVRHAPNYPCVSWRARNSLRGDGMWLVDPMREAVRTGHPSVVNLFCALGYGTEYKNSPFKYEEHGLNLKIIAGTLGSISRDAHRNIAELCVSKNDGDLLAVVLGKMLGDANECKYTRNYDDELIEQLLYPSLGKLLVFDVLLPIPTTQR